MPLPVEALSMLPTLAAGPSVSLASTAAAAAPVALGAAIGGKVLPQLFNKLAQASMVKAMPAPLKEAPAIWQNPNWDAEIHSEDVYSPEQADALAKLMRNASTINDTLTQGTLQAFDQQANMRAYRPYEDAVEFLDPESLQGLEGTAQNMSDAQYALDPTGYGDPNHWAVQYGSITPYDTPYTPRMPTDYGVPHRNTALGRWYAQHGGYGEVRNIPRTVTPMPYSLEDFDDLIF